MIMEYKVSALKYRPDEFNKVIGQNHVTDTLKNSIKENKIPSAILFCGPKGVGKTTCARIYAKEINKDSIELEKYDHAFNIFELDAASNRKIDDIRDLLEKVKIPPQIGKYKVYIIDEVHMLTKEAENAFLKTLEEPPSHIVFILATTEKNKILPTILSRCQIYDFKKISDQDSKNYLEEIIRSEGYKYEPKAISVIAKKAFGSLRDSLTILDRVINYTNGNITLEMTSQILNVLDTDTYLKFSELILKSSINEAIVCFNDLSNKGFGEKDFLEGLAQHFRDLVVAKASNSYNLNDDDYEFEKVLIQSNLIGQNILIEIIEIIENSIINLSNFENKKLVVEILLMKICNKNKSQNSLVPKKKNKILNSELAKSSEKNLSDENTKEEKKFRSIKPTESTNKKGVDDIKNISALSISSLKLKKQAKEEKDFIEAEKKKSTDEFDINDLKNKVDLYSKKINEMGKKSLSSIILINDPTIENNSVTFTLPSKASFNEFEIDKEYFTKFLRTELNNYEIKILAKIEEKKNQEYYSSPNEKLAKLVEINPLVGKFKDDLKLDL
ncbi:MAG: DNA polymerase III, subunit gamma and tau [Gammaproteobacteria bacterium]|nr:DNA polymerase III, subunit gamma and tau [Gammaproteobacteria bacterium]